MLEIVIACGVIAVLYGIFASRSILAASAGTERMQEIAGAIQEGANSAGEVIMHIRNSGMSHVDEHWVTKYYEEQCGES